MKKSKYLVAIAASMLLAACGGKGTSSQSLPVSIDQSLPTSIDQSLPTSSGQSLPSSSVEEYISSQALDSVKTSFEMLGGYVLTDSEGVDYVHSQNVVFAQNEHYYDEHYDGRMLDKLHLIRENSVIYLMGVDKDNALIKRDTTEIDPSFTWNAVANPFIGLTETDFVKESAGVFVISNAKANPLANALGGYIEITESVKLTVESNLVKRIEFTAMSLDGLSIYDFQVTDHGTAKGPVLPYETTPEHAPLKTALLALYGNYTIEHIDKSLGFDEAISCMYYMTEDAMYKDASDFEEQYGFFKYKDTTYEFEVNSGVATLGDISVTELEKIVPSFAFAPELFDYVSPNLYKAHDSVVASMIGAMIGEDVDAKMAASYAHSMTIELKDGKLHEINFSYNIYGQLISDITMIFTEIDTTILPIDLSGLKQEIDDSQPIEGDYSHMYGTYAGTFSSSPLTIVISSESITFNGEPAVFVEIDDNYDLVVTHGGKTYNITHESSYEPVAIMITDGTSWGLLSKQGGVTPEPTIELPTAIAGEWSVGEGTIDIDGNEILFNGNETTVVAFDELSGEIEFTCEGTTYFIVYLEAFWSYPEEFTLLDANHDEIAVGIRQGEVDPNLEVPEYMEGVWIINLTAGGTVRIEIVGDVVTFDGVTAVITEFDPYMGLYVEVEGVAYCLYHYVDYDRMDLYNSTGSLVGQCKVKGEQPTIELPTAIAGEWSVGEGTIDIEGNEILFNGNETTVVAFDEENGEIEFTCEGTTYFIVYFEAFWSYPEEFTLLDANHDEIAVGIRQGEVNPNLEVPEYMEGVWIINLTAGGTVRIEIVGDVVTFDGVTAVVTEFNSTMGLYIEVDGVAYCLYHYVDYDRMDLYDSADMRIGQCEEKGEQLTIASEYVGTFTGTMLSSREGFDDYGITVVITTTSITINSVSVTDIALEETSGYEFTYEGETFYLTSYDNGETIYLTNEIGDLYCNGAQRSGSLK